MVSILSRGQGSGCGSEDTGGISPKSFLQIFLIYLKK